MPAQQGQRVPVIEQGMTFGHLLRRLERHT
jgi:hypothetical protein